jgi:hypothetical protein
MRQLAGQQHRQAAVAWRVRGVAPCSSALAAAVGAGEQLGLAADRYATQCPLGGIVRQADAAVIEKAGEGRPALEHTVDRLSRGGVTRQPGAVVLHPALQVADQGLNALVPDGAPTLGRRTIDLAFDRQALVNAVHRLGRQRRSPQIGQLEELAPVVAPARGFDDTARRQL